MFENTEKILVQDRGFDAGLAALMQNANKGMDPAALMGMMNNGGFGGNNSWWIIILVLLFGWGGFGGNGFGNRGGAGALANELNTDANTACLMQAINGNKDAISSLATTLNCDVTSINNALCSIRGGIDKVAGEVGFSAERVINAVQAGDCSLASKLAECCCTTQRSIDAVNNNLTKYSYENQLAIANQTAALQASAANQFNIIGAKIDAQTTIINDKFCQLEMREMQNKIDTLRLENTNLALAASQQAQTANIVSQLRKPCPVPAYVVPNPNCCYNPLVSGVAETACGL